MLPQLTLLDQSPKLHLLVESATSHVSKLHGNTSVLQAIYVEEVPIRRIAFTTPKEERARLVEDGKEMYFEALEKLGLEGPE